MSFSFGLSLHLCPRCGEGVFADGLVFGPEPEHFVTKCENCRTTLEVSRDPISGQIRIKKAKRH